MVWQGDADSLIEPFEQSGSFYYCFIDLNHQFRMIFGSICKHRIS